MVASDTCESLQVGALKTVIVFGPIERGLPMPFETVNVKVKMPPIEGVPVIDPVEVLSVKPVGRAPEVTA